MIEQAGGLELGLHWSEIECADLTEAMVKDVWFLWVKQIWYFVQRGPKISGFFILGGCGCHKDLNTVKMECCNMAWWLENEWGLFFWPIKIMQQCYKGFSLKLMSLPWAKSYRCHITGGIKLQVLLVQYSIIRMTEGQQDTYKFWFEAQGILLNFPDTTTMFGTHCDAAQFCSISNKIHWIH